jgi:hypothetical protein
MPGQSAAAANGRNLEAFMAQALTGKNYVRLHPDSKKSLKTIGSGQLCRVTNGHPFYATNAQVLDIHSLYGVPWCLDILLWHPDKFPLGLVVEAKWQSVSGSTEDKLPFSVLSLAGIRDGGKANIVALMLDAAAMRPCVQEWVTAECARRQILLFRSPSAWAHWAHRAL